MIEEETVILITFIIIVVCTLYISLIHSIDYYYFNLGSSLTQRCGRDYVEIETARYHRYSNIGLDNILFMKAVMLVFSIYLLYVFISYHLTPVLGSIWNAKDDNEAIYKHFYGGDDKYISKWTMYSVFVYTTLIASTATVAGNFSRGSENLDYLAFLYLLPVGIVLLSLRAVRYDETRSGTMNTSNYISAKDYLNDMVFLAFNVYLVMTLTSIIQADKRSDAELPIVLGVFLFVMVFAIYNYNKGSNSENVNTIFLQPVFYGLIVFIIMGILSSTRSEKSESESAKYRSKIIELNNEFVRITGAFKPPSSDKQLDDFLKTSIILTKEQNEEEVTSEKPPSKIEEYVINRYNQLNKLDKHAYDNNIISDMVYLGATVGQDVDEATDDSFPLRKLPVMYIPFFGGGMQGVERMIQHFKNLRIKVDISEDERSILLRLYGDIANMDQEPSDLGTVFSGLVFFAIGYFAVSWAMKNM